MHSTRIMVMNKMKNNFLANLASVQFSYFICFGEQSHGCRQASQSSTPVCPRAVHTGVHEQYTRVSTSSHPGVRKSLIRAAGEASTNDTNRLDLLRYLNAEAMGSFFILCFSTWSDTGAW